MGVMKRIDGWNNSRWPIPRPLQELAGMVEPRDPGAYRDRKLAEAEARAEREAIRWEGRPSAAALEDPADDPGLGDELPVRAAPGWYRFGRTYYRIGSGPFAGWGFPGPRREPATAQGTLF